MTDLGEKLLEAARAEEEAMVSLILELASLESPSDVPEAQIITQCALLGCNLARQGRSKLRSLQVNGA